MTEIEANKSSHNAINLEVDRLRLERVQLARQRLACPHSFMYGTESSKSLFSSDGFVNEILLYFEKGLKYKLPPAHWLHGTHHSYAADRNIDGSFTFQKEDANFNHRLLKHLSYVLADKVGVEKVEEDTFVFCR